MKTGVARAYPPPTQVVKPLRVDVHPIVLLLSLVAKLPLEVPPRALAHTLW
jgi:hypothetical protein